MTNSTQKKTRNQEKTRDDQSTQRRALETALDFSVGGPVLAAQKVTEAVEKATDAMAERGEGIVRKGEDALRDRLDEGRERAGKAVRSVRKSVEAPDGRPYEDRTRDELYRLAIDREIRGRSSMRKVELIEALRENHA